jgi:hypothetical protein
VVELVTSGDEQSVSAYINSDIGYFIRLSLIIGYNYFCFNGYRCVFLKFSTWCVKEFYYVPYLCSLWFVASGNVPLD